MKYILTLASDLREAEETHIKTKKDIRRKIAKDNNGIQKKDDWKSISANKIKNSISDGDSLYINAHGRVNHANTGAHAEAIEYVKSDNLIQMANGEYKNGKEFYDWIKGFLPTGTKFKLKIFACYSAGSTFESQRKLFDRNLTFTGQFASALHSTHPEVIVYGYRDDVKMAATPDFPHLMAGKAMTYSKNEGYGDPDRSTSPHYRASKHREIFAMKNVNHDDYHWTHFQT